MKHSLPLVFALVAVVACGKSKTQSQKCEEARDKNLPKMEKLVEQVTGMSPPEQADSIRAQGQKELKLFKERFVDLCKKTKDFPFECTDKDPNKQSEDCKTKLAPFWKELYGPLPE